MFVIHYLCFISFCLRKASGETGDTTEENLGARAQHLWPCLVNLGSGRRLLCPGLGVCFLPGWHRGSVIHSQELFLLCSGLLSLPVAAFPAMLGCVSPASGLARHCCVPGGNTLLVC